MSGERTSEPFAATAEPRADKPDGESREPLRHTVLFFSRPRFRAIFLVDASLATRGNNAGIRRIHMIPSELLLIIQAPR